MMNRQREILGAMILDPTLADHPDLQPKLFSSGFERLTFEAILELRQSGSTVDLAELARSEKLREIDGILSMLSTLLDGQHRLKKKVFDEKLTTMIRNQLALKFLNVTKKADAEILKKIDPKLEPVEKAARKYITELDKLVPQKPVGHETLELFLQRQFPERRTLIDPILGLDEITMLHGRPKIGKSLLSLQLAHSIMTGEDWLGFRVYPPVRPTLIIQSEVRPSIMQERIKKVFSNSKSLKKIIVPTIEEKILLDQKHGQNIVAQLIKDIDPSLIIVDPYAEFFTKTETALKESKPFFDFFKDQLKQHSFSLFFIHHDAKSTEDKLGGQKALGETAISGSTDGNWNIERIINADLSPVEFNRTARISFESRNWQSLKPIDIRLSDQLHFETITLQKSSVTEWDIVEEIESAGGQIAQSELIKKFSSVKMFYKAKSKAEKMGLIDSAKLSEIRGSPVMLMLKTDGTGNVGE
jgi:hypothetical protein